MLLLPNLQLWVFLLVFLRVCLVCALAPPHTLPPIALTKKLLCHSCDINLLTNSQDLSCVIIPSALQLRRQTVDSLLKDFYKY